MTECVDTWMSVDISELVELANDMLRQLHSVKRVKQLRDINASVFVTLFEGLCGEQLPGEMAAELDDA